MLYLFAHMRVESVWFFFLVWFRTELTKKVLCLRVFSVDGSALCSHCECFMIASMIDEPSESSCYNICLLISERWKHFERNKSIRWQQGAFVGLLFVSQWPSNGFGHRAHVRMRVGVHFYYRIYAYKWANITTNARQRIWLWLIQL